tara:strand:+ start:421 stop:570 length:150 start_codon:yes stop_codon:yes gene_type:complete
MKREGKKTQYVEPNCKKIIITNATIRCKYKKKKEKQIIKRKDKNKYILE